MQYAIVGYTSKPKYPTDKDFSDMSLSKARIIACEKAKRNYEVRIYIKAKSKSHLFYCKVLEEIWKGNLNDTITNAPNRKMFYCRKYDGKHLNPGEVSPKTGRYTEFAKIRI